MQKKTVFLLKMLMLASVSIFACSAVAQNSLSSFEQALKDTGWSVEQGADGSLILESRNQSDNPENQAISEEEQWSQFQSELQSVGWSVERDKDGSLRLTPPEPENAVEPESISAATDAATTVDQSSIEGLQEKLQGTGWKVTASNDGSIELYPPEKTLADKPQPCPGTASTVAITLPVDSWKEAHEISQGWLSSHPPFNATVGKIRRILNVYLVSIVATAPPFSLVQQIAIRTSDGAVIVLN